MARARGLWALAGVILGSVSLMGSMPSEARSQTSAGSTALVVGTPRPLSPWTFGLNGSNVSGPAYSDGAFADGIVALGPGTLRYPGGTVANFWNWHVGWFEAGGPWPGQPGNRIDASLATYGTLVRRTGSTPVFDLNVVTWQGRI